jgi:hypothetical protein
VSPDPLSLWVIKQLVGAASHPLRTKVINLILGDPLQRALKKPTNTALEAAVATVLGDDPTEEQHQRAVDILAKFWNDDLDATSGSFNATITEALYNIVAAGINEANAPIEGLSAGEYFPTTSLTALSDELGIRIDADEFAAAFLSRWLKAIRDESLINHDLQQLAQLLAHEQTQHQIDQLRLGSEQQLTETVWAAVQSLYEQILRDGGLTVERRRQWFDLHVGPAHQLMEEIAADYQSGFGETLDALRSGVGLEEAMQRLKAIRRRKIIGRTSLEVVARKLRADSALFGTSLDAALLKYVEAAQAFKRSDSPLDPPAGTWYSHYIEKFGSLIDRGQDPRLRSNYSGISGVVDLQGQLAVPLDKVVDLLLPQRWEAYMEAYEDLRNAALATG